MQTYKVIVKEELEREIEVTAKSESEALGKIEDDYYNQKIVLDSSDYERTTFEAFLLDSENEDADDPSRER